MVAKYELKGKFSLKCFRFYTEGMKINHLITQEIRKRKVGRPKIESDKWKLI